MTNTIQKPKVLSSETIAYKTTATTLATGERVVVYYKTPIVTISQDSIILSTGDWWTMMTCRRMNLVSRLFKFGYVVSRKQPHWVVKYRGDSHDFATQKIRLDRKTGQVTPIEE